VGVVCIYPRGKAFEFNISQAQPAWGPINAGVRNRGWRGLKIYLWAKRRDDMTLAVSLQQLPDQNQNW
jgi:hypothetical protein